MSPYCAICQRPGPKIPFGVRCANDNTSMSALFTAHGCATTEGVAGQAEGMCTCHGVHHQIRPMEHREPPAAHDLPPCLISTHLLKSGGVVPAHRSGLVAPIRVKKSAEQYGHSVRSFWGSPPALALVPVCGSEVSGFPMESQKSLMTWIDSYGWPQSFVCAAGESCLVSQAPLFPRACRSARPSGPLMEALMIAVSRSIIQFLD
jgi:hypothetical protein